MHTKFWSGNLKVGDHLEVTGVDEMNILEWILERNGMEIFGLDVCGSGWDK
jgi:hypothetical protein